MMSNTLRENLLRQLEQAEEAYTQELENGGPDTEQYRQQVAGLKRNLETLDADETARQEATEAEVESQMIEQAEVEVQAACDAIRAELRERADILLPEITLPLNVAVSVRHAGRALQVAQVVEVAAKDKHEALAQRIQKHEATRQSIINRRAAGSGDDESDKGALLLAAEDMEGLRPLIDNALTELQQARAATRQMQAAFDGAMGQWGTAVNNERRRATGMHCQTLDTALVNSSLPVLGAEMMSFGYVPSLGLKTLIQRFTG